MPSSTIAMATRTRSPAGRVAHLDRHFARACAGARCCKPSPALTSSVRLAHIDRHVRHADRAARHRQVHRIARRHHRAPARSAPSPHSGVTGRSIVVPSRRRTHGAGFDHAVRRAPRSALRPHKADGFARGRARLVASDLPAQRRVTMSGVASSSAGPPQPTPKRCEVSAPDARIAHDQAIRASSAGHRARCEQRWCQPAIFTVAPSTGMSRPVRRQRHVPPSRYQS